MKKSLALALALLLGASVAFGQSQQSIKLNDGGNPTLLGGSGGLANVNLATNLTNLASSVIIVSALSIDGPQANSSLPLTGASLTPYTNSAPHLVKWARVLVTGTAGDSVNAPWSVRFYGSFDGANYAPLLRTVAGEQVLQQYGGTARPAADTLKVRGRGPMATYNGGSGVQGSWFPLISQGMPVPHKYIVAVCSVDTTAAATAGNSVFTVEIGGRDKW